MNELSAAYEHCRAITRRSGSSFASAFWLLPAEKRRALHAIYAFCRLADDIADDPEVKGDRGLLLGRWHEELDAAYRRKPTHPVSVALCDAVHRHELPRFAFEDLLAGIELDLTGEEIQHFEELRRYCYCVAGTVGILVVHLLGARGVQAQRYAETMGVAVQLTNVLRDVRSDALEGRHYLPSEDLERFGVQPEDLRAQQPPGRLRLLLAAYAEHARLHFEQAAALRPKEPDRALRGADAMGAIYRRLLERVSRTGFEGCDTPVRLSRGHRAAIAGRAFLGWEAA